MKAIYCIPVALAYQIATNPFVLAVLLSLAGYWQAGAWYLGAYLFLCLVAVMFGVQRPSRLPGLEHTEIVTAPDWLFVLGDEQQGWLPQWLIDKWPSWVPYWWVAFSCCAWRNKLRNLPFVSCLSWLHRPQGELRVTSKVIAGIRFTLRTRGWMVELEWAKGRRFGDFGPRLDQPDEWGGVSWAFRPFGRW